MQITGDTKIKKYLLFLGVIILVSIFSIFLQHKYNLAYKIVYLENKYFHKEEYKIEKQLSLLYKNLPFHIYRLDIKGEIKFSISPEYTITIFIPREYIILNPSDIQGFDPNYTGYISYDYTFSSRDYRSVKGKIYLLIYTAKNEILEKPVRILMRRDNNILYKDEYFVIKTEGKQISGKITTDIVH